MSDHRIMEACKMVNIKLAKACELAGVKYGTLYNQIRFEREIPFATVVRISNAIGVPIGYFASSEAKSIDGSVRNRWENAGQANKERAECTHAGFTVDTDTVLDWFHKHNGKLENWAWFEDQVDLFHPLEPTDRLMRPIQIGKRSLTSERLMLSGNRDYYRVVGKFSKERVDRAMMSHRMVNELPYLVTDETLDVTIKGVRVQGGYRKVTMRLTGAQGEPVNATFSQLTWLNRN
ncbi:MAG: helix-turn-helix transcriptional regulator [Thalassovita sp.]